LSIKLLLIFVSSALAVPLSFPVSPFYLSFPNVHAIQSIALLSEVSSKGLYALVEFSRILRNFVGHDEFGVEGSDDVEGLGLGNAGSAMLLNKETATFLR
jgi:hypothetical protein